MFLYIDLVKGQGPPKGLCLLLRSVASISTFKGWRVGFKQFR